MLLRDCRGALLQCGSVKVQARAKAVRAVKAKVTCPACGADDVDVPVIRCERGAGSGVSSTATLAEQRLAWERAVAPHGFERVARCRACYAIRLANACKAASELGFTYISTTLAVSPYQLFDDCSAILERTARACGLVPVTRDWRPLYPQATRESRERGMYRQNYCGCPFSHSGAPEHKE